MPNLKYKPNTNEHITSHTKEMELRNLPEVDKIERGDFLVIEKPSGTRKIREDKLDSIKTPIEHSLDSGASYKALSAGMGRELKTMIDNIEKVTVIDNLTSLDKRAALSANQGAIIKGLIDEIPKIQVIDRLDSTSTNYALSANQGNEIRRMIEDLASSLVPVATEYSVKLDNQTLSAAAIHELVDTRMTADSRCIDGLLFIDNELKLMVDGEQVGPSVLINTCEGKEGLNAYEIACKNGFIGTEVDWLRSLSMDIDYVIESGILTDAMRKSINCEKFPTQLSESMIFVSLDVDGQLVECNDMRDVIGVLMENGLCKYSGCVDIKVHEKSRPDMKIGKFIKPTTDGVGVVSDYEGYRIVKVSDDTCTILLK